MTAYEEKKKHSSQLVPFSYYKCRIPGFFADVPLHWHGEFEINHIISGCGEFICGGKKLIASDGDLIVIPPNMLHAIYRRGGSELIYDTVVFSAEMLGISENDRSAAECVKPLANGGAEINVRISKEHFYYGALITAAENIFSCAKGNSPRLDMLMKSELLRFFWLLDEAGDVSRNTGGAADKTELIRSAIEYMNENFTEKITVAQLADISHMSKSYFMRIFKDASGVGAIEYLSRIRIKKVCGILADTDKTAAEAAFECGFGNLSNFNRQFRNTVGCTPKEYRKLSVTDRLIKRENNIF
ncbi:MAG: helix-turn-helix domain-containing protein [Ruminococcus sp.]|nr:helix-turn-helix domain-containing protein [Ruminococcus sp.]